MTKSPTENRDKRHARLDRAANETAARLHLSPDDEQRVLAERARRLAVRTEHAYEDGTIELLFFRVGEEHLAIETSLVSRVGAFLEPSPVPWAPDLFLGLVNHRGRPLPVVSLPALLGRKAPPTADFASLLVLVVGDAPDELGLSISAADEVRTVSLHELSTSGVPEHLRDLGFIRALLDGHVLVLDAPALLGSPRLSLPASS